jgi:hypothetical protein
MEVELDICLEDLDVRRMGSTKVNKYAHVEIPT